MSGNTLNFATLAAESPATPPVGWVQATGSNNASIVQLATKQWQGGPQAVWYDSAEMQGDVIRSVVKLGTSASANSCGPAIVTTAGNGYMVLCNNASTRLYKCVGSQLGSQIGSNIGTILAASSVIALEIRLSDGRIRIFNMTSGSDVQVGGDFTDTTYHPRYGAAMSRYGYLQSVSSLYSWQQYITSINGGNPITAGQTTSSAVTTGFTGLPASITSNVTGLTFSGIGGTTNAPTFTKSVRTDGAIYPKDGVTALVTFVNGAESASTTILCNKNADETEVVAALPINDDITCLFGAIFAETGRSAANGDEVYHAIPPAMLTNGVDTILPADAIAPNGEMQFYNAGTFQCWVWTAATGVYYYYDVTVTEAGISVVSGGLTTKLVTGSKLTVSRLVARRI